MQRSNIAYPAIFHNLRTGKDGLSHKEAGHRLRMYGPNVLPEGKRDSLFIIFLRQFQSPLIYILIGASGIVFAMNEIIDGAIILFVLLFNAVVGTIEEGKAESASRALKNFVQTNAIVLREGEEIIIPDKEVAPGDIIILREGEKIPADAGIIFSHNLKVDEAALTGESEPIHKTAGFLWRDDIARQDSKNMLFKGTHVVAGNGQAIVINTGPNTAIGKIAKEVMRLDTEIPLKVNIRYLSRFIIVAAAAINIILFVLGIMLGKSVKEMFTTVVSLSVSIIPEGLPIVMTLVLVTGVWRMAKQNALVKRLQAVEALGQARVIAVDKTGTITKNELVIQKVYVNGKFFEVDGVGYEPKGHITLDNEIIEPSHYPELLFLGRGVALNAGAVVAFQEETREWKTSGDPTEAALLVFAEKVGLHKDDIERTSPLISEIPFDYKTKYHVSIHSVDDRPFLTVIGAPETILRLTRYVWRNGKPHILVSREKEEIESVVAKFSWEGLRVVAIAIKKETQEDLSHDAVNDLTFVGLLGMKDALRLEVKEALARASAAGIRVVMITGDHRITAKAIAKEAGIYHEGEGIITGEDIDMIDDDELSERVDSASIFARVMPEHKLRIISAFRKRGDIVAMTGDGVNDAPSLVAADLGVAMGKIGTEVAKEASDIVLLDDNFGSIISAIEEGRSIYKTIRKVILYLFSTSLGEVFTIAGALFFGYPLPILASQIIWLNLVTDGFLDIALAMEPKEKGLLHGNFERPKKYLVDWAMASRMFIMAVPMTIGTLFLFNRYFETDIVKAWTISLTALAVFQWLNAWNCRSDRKSIFGMNPVSNIFLVGATGIVITLHLFALYTPFMQKILHTTPLTLQEWFIIIPIAFSIIAVEEIRKGINRISGFGNSPKIEKS